MQPVGGACEKLRSRTQTFRTTDAESQTQGNPDGQADNRKANTLGREILTGRTLPKSVEHRLS